MGRTKCTVSSMLEHTPRYGSEMGRSLVSCFGLVLARSYEGVRKRETLGGGQSSLSEGRWVLELEFGFVYRHG